VKYCVNLILVFMCRLLEFIIDWSVKGSTHNIVQIGTPHWLLWLGMCRIYDFLLSGQNHIVPDSQTAIWQNQNRNHIILIMFLISYIKQKQIVYINHLF